MPDTKTETPADEMRTAATRLRCDHGYPCNPPGGTVWAPGPCMHCGQEYPNDDEIVPEALREPLASWLVRTAESFDDEVRGHLHDTCDGALGEDCTCFAAALATARAINGSAT